MCVSVQLANDAFIRVIYVKNLATLKNIGYSKMLNIKLRRKAKVNSLKKRLHII